jgi:hypothetical protein
MYQIKQLGQRKVSQQEVATYFDAMLNNSSFCIKEQDEHFIIQFFRQVASTADANKTELNGKEAVIGGKV